MIDADVYAHIEYGSLEDEMKLVQADKCIVFAWLLLQLLGNTCREPSCPALLDVQVVRCGFCVKLVWKCSGGHAGSWYASPIYASGFGINYLVNTAVLVSGGAISQFHRFCDFLHIFHESQDSFYRYVCTHLQSLYICVCLNSKMFYMCQTNMGQSCTSRNQRFYAAQAINQMFEEGQKAILELPQMKEVPLVVCGDARMYSPGFSATKATYSFM